MDGAIWFSVVVVVVGASIWKKEPISFLSALIFKPEAEGPHFPSPFLSDGGSKMNGKRCKGDFRLSNGGRFASF